MYLNVVGIPPSPKRNITKNTDFCNYDENDKEDKYKREVDCDVEVAPFLDAIANEKDFDDNRENPVYMVGEGNVEVEDQSGKFVPISNYKIDATEKDNFYDEIFQKGIKKEKATIKKSLKERIKVDMQNRLTNVTIAKFNKTSLAHLTETETWRLLRRINTAVLGPKNEFTGDRAPEIPYDNYAQVPVKYDLSETCEREKFNGICFDKGELHNLINCLCKLQSHNLF